MYRLLLLAIIFVSCISIDAKNNYQQKSYLVVGNNLNVRAKPSVKSKIILKLNVPDYVILEKRSKFKFKQNEIKGTWVYINTGKRKNILKKQNYYGWVLDYFLAKENQFTKVKKFYDCMIEGYAGDYHVKYQFFKKGKFKHFNKDHKSNKIEIITGDVLRYRDVILIKAKSSDGYNYKEFFHIEKNRLYYSYNKEISASLK